MSVNIKLGKLCFVILLTMLLFACSKTEGTEIDPNNLGYKTCTTSIDCGEGSYCDPDKSLCMNQCSASKDCFFMDPAAIEAWQKAQEDGISFEDMELPELTHKCSECGRCIPVEQERDELCAVLSVELCNSDAECAEKLGEEYVSGGDGYGTLKCENNEDCSVLGRGHNCGYDPNSERKVCYKYCYDDSTCAYHGYSWRCDLPEGVDQNENFFSNDSVIGHCKPFGSIDWGEHEDATKETNKFVGIFGAINESTFTNCGFPLVNCQDTTNIHHMLFRVRQTENGIELDGKYCLHEASNFKPDDDNPTMDIINFEEDVAWMEVPARYTMAVAYHHWTAEPTSFEVGDAFRTSHYLEIRGAVLEDPKNDPLPTKENLENQWDQDRDGNPGATTVMNGLITGEIWNVNRADQFGDFEIAQLGENGRVEKFKGLLTTENESGILGASNPLYEVVIEPNLYVDDNRSYMRFMRLPDDATCTDVVQLGSSEENCDINYNNIRISVDDDSTYLCHTPTVDGPKPLEDTKK